MCPSSEMTAVALSLFEFESPVFSINVLWVRQHCQQPPGPNYKCTHVSYTGTVDLRARA